MNTTSDKLGNIWISLIKGELEQSSVISFYFKNTLSPEVLQSLVENIASMVMVETGVSRQNGTINYTGVDEFFLVPAPEETV